MKKTVLLNSEISSLIASLGEDDFIIISNAAFSVPKSCKKIDLAVNLGLPGFLDVLDAVLSEYFADKSTLASEIRENNPEIEEEIISRCGDCPVEYLPHEELKNMAKLNNCIAVIRTGEASPFANIVLHSGLTF